MPSRLALASCLVLLAGCGKSPDSIPTPSAAIPAASRVTTNGPAADSGAPSMDESQMATVLASLTQAVRKYGLEQKRAPKNLEELVAQGYLATGRSAGTTGFGYQPGY